MNFLMLKERYLRRNVVITAISGFLIAYSTRFIDRYLPIKLSEVSGVVAVGVAYTVARVLSVISLPISGIAADTLGRKVVSLLPPILYISAILAILNPLTVPLGVVLISLAPYIVGNCIALITLEDVDKDSRGVVMSIISAISTAGAIASYLTIPVLMVWLGLENAAIIVLCLLAVSLIARLFYRETLEARQESDSVSIGMFFSSMVTHLRSGLKVALKRPLVYLTLFGVSATFASELISIYIPIILARALKVGLIELGIVYAVSIGASLASRALCAFAVRKIGYVYSISIPTALAALALLAMYVAKSSIAIIAFFALLGAMEGFINVAEPVLAVNLLDKHPDLKATAMNFMDTLSILVSIPAPLVGAALWEVSALALTIVSAAVLLVSALIILSLRVYEHA